MFKKLFLLIVTLMAVPASSNAMMRSVYKPSPSRPMMVANIAQKPAAFAGLNSHMSSNAIFRSALQSHVIASSKQHVPLRNFSASRPAQNKWYDFASEVKRRFKQGMAQELFEAIHAKLQGKSDKIYENASIEQLISRFPKDQINARFACDGSSEDLLNMIIKKTPSEEWGGRTYSLEQVNFVEACIKNGAQLTVQHTISSIKNGNSGAFKVILMNTKGDGFSEFCAYSYSALTQKHTELNQQIEKLKQQRDNLHGLQARKKVSNGVEEIICSPEYWNCLRAIEESYNLKRRLEAMLADLALCKNFEFLKNKQRSNDQAYSKYQESARKEAQQAQRVSHNTNAETESYGQYQQPNEKALIEFLTKCRKGANSQEILGVSSRASKDEFKKAYRLLLLKCHPDKFAYNQELMKLANEATQNLNSAYKMCL